MSIGVMLGLPSSLFGILDKMPAFVPYFAALFGVAALITLLWVRRQPVLDNNQVGSAAGWLAGAITGCAVCLIGMAAKPTQASTVAVLAVDPSAPACNRIVALGFKCSTESLYEAMASNNVEAINLMVEGGVRLTEDNFGISSFRDDALENYVKAAHKAGGLKMLTDSCKKDGTADSAFGCAVVRDQRGLACALRPYRENDKKFEAYKVQSVAASIEIALKPYNEISSANCESGDHVSAAHAGATYTTLADAERDCEYNSPTPFACRMSIIKKICGEAKSSFLKDNPDRDSVARKARADAEERFARYDNTYCNNKL